MCFSAGADLVVGLAVGSIGIDALRHVRRADELPLAALPVVLAAHQLIESFVWWGLEGRLPDAVWRPALWVYLVIAFGVLPVLLPVAVRALEPEENRPRLGFVALGVGVAAVLTFAVLRGPVEAVIEGHHIAYRVDLWRGGVVVALYVVATCGPLLVSAHNHVRWFGAVNLVAVLLLAWVSTSGLISLWCGWAAVTSVAIAVHLRYADQPPRSNARSAIP